MQYRIGALKAAVSRSDVEITWDDAAASQYLVIFSKTKDCKSPAYTFGNITTNHTTATAVADGTYYICVMAIEADGQWHGAENNGYEVTINSLQPGVFQVTSPRTRTNLLTPIISWSAAADADSYRVTVAADAACKNIVQSFPWLAGTSIPLTAPLADHTTYTVCVQARNAAQNIREVSASFATDTTTPTAVLSNLPSSVTTAAALNVTVGGSQVAYYRYALIPAAGSCSGATYSSPFSAATPISDALTTGNSQRLCVIGIDPFQNTQTIATEHVFRRKMPPQLSFTNLLDNSAVIAKDASFTVNWTATSPDGDATVALYAKASASGACTTGTLVMASRAQAANGAADGVIWNTTGFAPGSYSLCASVSDGLNPTVSVWSPGALAINAPPTISFTSLTTTIPVPQAGSYTITYTPADSDDDAAVSLYYGSANTGCSAGLAGWQSIATGLAENTVNSHAWDTTGVTAGTYYLCAKIDDGVNAPVFAVSTGRIKVNAVPTLTLDQPNGYDTTPLGRTVTISWTGGDPDDDALMSLFVIPLGSSPCSSGTSIATNIAINGASTQGWVPTGLTPGLFFICGVVNDGVNPAVEAFSHVFFVTRPCTWNGSVSSDFADYRNWDGCGATPPGDNDEITVPGGTPNDPILSSNATIAGFGVGTGGGTLTINAGTTLIIKEGANAFLSSIELRGAVSPCTTCIVEVRTFARVEKTIRRGATLTLGKGITIYLLNGGPFFIGDGKTGGNLVTQAAGAANEWPIIDLAVADFVFVRGGAGQKSLVDWDGIVFRNLEPFRQTMFYFQDNFTIQNFDNVTMSYKPGYGIQEFLLFAGCSNSAVNDTAWSNVTMSGIVASSARVANDCATNFPLVTISGSGTGYGAGIEDDYNNRLTWVNGDSTTCTWLGGTSTDWTLPGNWSGCTNGRGNYPDQNDDVIIPTGTPHAPHVSGAIPIRGFAQSGSGGGTVYIDAGGTLSISSSIWSSVTLEGDSPGCTTCLVQAVRNGGIAVSHDATLTLNRGIRFNLVNDRPLLIGDGYYGPGHFVTAGGSNPAEWPTLSRNAVSSYSNGGIYVTGLSAGQRSTVAIDGLKVLELDPNNAGISQGLHFNRYFDVTKLDNITMARRDAPSNSPSFIQFADCTGSLFSATTWNNLRFDTAMSATGGNIRLGASCTTPLSVVGDSASPGFGAAWESDPNGILSWIP